MNYKIAVITGSPNKDGLTAACGAAAEKGILAAAPEAQVDLIDLNSHDVGRCKACGSGYGTCRSEHRCQVKDDFQALHERLAAADAYVVVTPVYWGDLSESVKAFLDRVRRCEATAREASRLAAKPCIGVAAAGGGGNGTITCLLTMQQFFGHVRSEIFDLITVTRKSRPYKLQAIEAAGKAMVHYMQQKAAQDLSK
ncbi:MAG: flavodoxin family protein [Bacillota bacterium]